MNCVTAQVQEELQQSICSFRQMISKQAFVTACLGLLIALRSTEGHPPQLPRTRVQRCGVLQLQGQAQLVVREQQRSMWRADRGQLLGDEARRLPAVERQHADGLLIDPMTWMTTSCNPHFQLS